MMCAVLDRLRSWGCDVAGAMERMAGEEDFYISCLQEVVADPYFEKLKEALDAGRVSEAFDAAHTLKGVFANVGLTPMYDKTVEIVEPLRAGVKAGINEKYGQLLQMRRELNELLAMERT